MQSSLRSFACLPRVGFWGAVLGVAVSCVSGIPAHAVTIDWVTVGDPGNANDTINTGTTPNYGAVATSFQIGKYDVTIGQYTQFLNAAAATDPYSLYNTSMESALNIAGISRAGSSGSYTYSVIGSSGNKPITYVSWWDAARFANWMQNGQGSGSTETGAYTLGGATSGTAPAVNPGATFYIPTENQWYKAAYYSPALNSGAGGYYLYATQSNTAPGNVIGSAANQANYRTGAGYSVTQSSSRDPNQNYLTDAGAFSGSASFYGTFDQDGNVYQWNDLAGTSGSSRGLRGGAWTDNTYLGLSSSGRISFNPSSENNAVGFRLASPVSVPEPSTCVMALAGIACGGFSMWRRRKRSRSGGAAPWAPALAAVLLCSTNARAVTIDWVTVGDPGNANDTINSGTNPNYGAVATSFQIMKYEFTNQQYTDFLNSVAATDTYSLYNTSMGSNARGGITQSGASGSYTYAAKTNMGDKPVNYVSWFDVARVSNWLMNGATGTSSTETGAYTLNGATSGTAPTVNPGATYSIPTENQWYKAAYYKGGSTNAGYWTYATQSNSAPTAVTAGATGIGSAGSAGNFANYNYAASWNSQGGNVTTVGTNGGPSAYGAFDMSGNVSEWNDGTAANGWTPGRRGGPFGGFLSSLSSAVSFTGDQAGSNETRGFRLVSPVAVPEPSTCVMALAGLACGGFSMFRRRRAR